MKYLFLKGNSARKIYNDMSVTLGDKSPSCCTVKNWVAGFRGGHLSTEGEESSEKPSDSSRKHGCHSFHDPGRYEEHPLKR
jgi:hypothetical protein